MFFVLLGFSGSEISFVFIKFLDGNNPWIFLDDACKHLLNQN